MKSVITFVFSLLALAASQVVAVPQNRVQRPGDHPSVTCGTVYGPSRTLMGRWTTTRTTTIRSTTTLLTTKRFTTTPWPSTTSVTSTVKITVTTTLSTPTNTISTTITERTTSLITTTIAQTTTSVITSTVSDVSTSTIPAPAGFTPIESSLTEVPPAPPTKRELARRDPLPKGIGQNKWESKGKTQAVQHNYHDSFPGYPQNVQCSVVISKTLIVSVTSTISKTSTAPRPIVTITSTTTSVSTSVVNPNSASLTITSTTTTTLSSTISTTEVLTQTSTTTSTSYTSTDTVYAACATNNVLGQYNGFGIGSYSYAASNYVVTPSINNDITNALDCCILAQQNSLTWFYVFLQVENVESGTIFRQCTVISGEFCPVPLQPTVVSPGTTRSAAATIGYATDVAPSAGFIVGNGACGVVPAVTRLSGL